MKTLMHYLLPLAAFAAVSCAVGVDDFDPIDTDNDQEGLEVEGVPPQAQPNGVPTLSRGTSPPLLSDPSAEEDDGRPDPDPWTRNPGRPDPDPWTNPTTKAPSGKKD
jgi:hypothetical protein